MPTLCPTRLMGSVGASVEMKASRSESKLGTCNADDAGRDHWPEPRESVARTWALGMRERRGLMNGYSIAAPFSDLCRVRG